MLELLEARLMTRVWAVWEGLCALAAAAVRGALFVVAVALVVTGPVLLVLGVAGVV